jgi:hypothetical protein
VKIRCPICESKFDSRLEYRSVPHLRRYMVMCRAAYLHWPEWHDTQFANANECRKWLQMRAGHYEVVARAPIDGVRPELLIHWITIGIRAAGSYAVAREIDGDLVIFKPLSVAFDKMSHKDAVSLFSAVEEVIEHETEMKVEELMAHANQV